MKGPYVAGLQSAIHQAGLPYGFTITIFCSGQGLVHFHGPPEVELLFLFAAGAATAFGLLKLLTREADGHDLHLGASRHPVRAGAIHVSAIGLGIASATVLGTLPENLAWPLSALAATFVYFAVSAIELALFERDG